MARLLWYFQYEQAAEIIGSVTITGMLDGEDCEHGTMTYELTADEVTVTGNVNKTGDNQWTVDVVVDLQQLLDQYNSGNNGGHTFSGDSSANLSLTLVYNTETKEWTLKDDDSEKLDITVACNPTVGPEPGPGTGSGTTGGGGGTAGGGTGGTVDIPDNPPPLSDQPGTEEPGADLPEEQPPLSELPGEPAEELPDGDTPLADVPETGDASLFWVMAAALSAAGLIWLGLNKKREDEI